MEPTARPAGVYVTGTDTGIGKTVASTALLHALRARGLRAAGMKPVASGCERVDGAWRNEDALALQAASDPRPAYADANPFALPDATAPEIAARRAGVAVDLAPIAAAYGRIAAQADVVVVEGVGGWAAPLSARLDQIDVVRLLGLPVLLVVGNRLGCINHARLSAAAVAAAGARLLGWIGNDVDPQLRERDEYFALLGPRLPAPCLGRLPYRAAPDPRADAAALDLAPLLEGLRQPRAAGQR
ncbi:dethiobiotin synthase [Vulcaniibacterium tengchongense]|uniref:ATP-dependent dethiobiotin synthetase BioD n=1 Tax=Vulcaniibacterium tengchongense TaxID=1273429 RepID=A0A3N4V064_9GAMM|nr:dethiobiotin synthase [Vulcaniibacterium tengchongense]RPE75818.1 dethiobiotin synthase [Vulcaniibacterium tengchongense]